MRNTRSFITYFQVFRCISSSSAYSNLHREGKFIKKLLHGTHKSKRKWHDPKTDLDNTLGFEQTNKVSAQTTRRMVIRDKLFMKHITDLMSMGEISDIISGSIEITHVKITSDYKLVNVFWIHSTDDVSSFISEETLQKCAKIIRHELSQLRVIGIVPPIQFVEDKQFAIGKEVERRLAMINYEDDKSEYSEQIQLDASHTDIIDQVSHAKPDTNYDSEIDKSYIELPMMRYDVLGLDHNKIMSRIIASVSKSKEAALRRQMLDINTNVDENSSNQISKENFLTQKEQENIFFDFLITRRREERRLHRTRKLLKHELLNNFEEEIESNCNEPEDNCNHDYDEFENDYRDENSDKFNS